MQPINKSCLDSRILMYFSFPQVFMFSKSGWARCTPLIPVLGKQANISPCVRDQPGQH